MKYMHIGILVIVFSSAFATILSRNAAESSSGCLERISRHVNELATASINTTISFKNISISNSLISECMKKIEQQQSFAPLIETWDIIKQYYCNDEKLLCQFCILLLLDYYCVIHAKIHNNKRFMLITLISLYAQLNAIPLAKLFEVLEECLAKYNEIADALAPYEDVPFYLWIQNNWWVPATLAGFTLISYFKWRKAHNQNIAIQKATVL